MKQRTLFKEKQDKLQVQPPNKDFIVYFKKTNLLGET